MASGRTIATGTLIVAVVLGATYFYISENLHLFKRGTKFMAGWSTTPIGTIFVISLVVVVLAATVYMARRGAK
jgi:hypothetical protein